MGMVMYLRRASIADIARLQADPRGVPDFVFDDAAPDQDLVEFDKAWQALHFMLSGEAYGMGRALGIIAEETPMQSSDGIGSLEYSIVPPERMVTFDAALKALDDGSLAQRYDPAAMAAQDVYLADSFLNEGPEALEYILQGVPALRRFAASCADAGCGAIRVLA